MKQNKTQTNKTPTPKQPNQKTPVTILLTEQVVIFSGSLYFPLCLLEIEKYPFNVIAFKFYLLLSKHNNVYQIFVPVQ